VAEDAPSQARATTGELLAAIRKIPEQVAARVGGTQGESAGGGRQEVTFAPEEVPAPEDDEPSPPGAPEVPVAPEAHRKGFPGRRRRRVEMGV
jgi:hypothetical protein